MIETDGVAIRPRKSGYLPSLDGWRALAIIGVMMTHDRSWVIFHYSLSQFMGYGGYGVYLFFAISGFLITTRILEEEIVVGRFHIGRFYIRRLFRIQPAALAYLAVVALLLLVGLLPVRFAYDTWHSWLASLFLYLNLAYRPSDPIIVTGHFWTLAVEEHFYILLSLTLFFFKKSRILVLTILFIAFTLPLVLLSRHDGPQWYIPGNFPRSTPWQITPLLLASLFALLVRKPEILRGVKQFLRPWVAFTATCVIAASLRVVHLKLTHTPLTLHHMDAEFPFIATYLMIFWIAATVFHPASVTARFLELRPLRFVGRISYSLYLWHVMTYHFWNAFVASPPHSSFSVRHTTAFQLLQYAAKYGIALATATLSYYFIEKPFVRMGHKLAPSATPGRPELADLPVEPLDSNILTTRSIHA